MLDLKGTGALAKQIKLPLLKAVAMPDGRLRASHRQVPLPPVDEGWWQSVLLDTRALYPEVTSIPRDSAIAWYRLDRQTPEIVVRCECGANQVLDRDTMIAQVGADMNVIHLVREWMPCRVKTRNKMVNNCRAYVVR